MREQYEQAEDMSTRRPATYEDLLAVPEHLVAEIIDGELVTSPRPRPRHALATGALHGALYDPIHRGHNGPGGWMIVIEPEVHLGADVLVPDLAGWRRERVPRLPTQAWFPLVPDWVCEVLSPSTVAIDRGKKLAIYAREGVEHAWLVDPIAQTVEILRRDRDGWLLAARFADRESVRAEPFAAIDIELALLWE